MGELVDGAAIGGNLYKIEAVGCVFISGERRNLGKIMCCYFRRQLVRGFQGDFTSYTSMAPDGKFSLAS